MYCLQTLDLYKVLFKIKSLKIELKMLNYKKGLCLIAMILSDMFTFVSIFIYLGLYRYIYVVIFIDLNLYISCICSMESDIKHHGQFSFGAWHKIKNKAK